MNTLSIPTMPSTSLFSTDSSSTASPDIHDCIKSKDFLGLKEIGINDGFADNNTTRLRCYSILLGCGGLDVYDENEEGCNKKFKQIDENEYTHIIGRDILRNGYSRWDKTANYSDYQKSYDLQQIEKLLNVVFTEYPEFNYIQSFDSVFALFYLIANGNLFIAKKLIVSYLHIFKSDLAMKQDNFGHLNAIWSYLKKYDAAYYKWLMHIVGDCQDVSFALEWYIAWFSHCSISDFSTILRIYDFMISTQNQSIGLYMVLAVLLLNKKQIMQNVENLSDFIVFTKSGLSFDKDSVSQLITKCHQIMQSEMKEEQRRNSWKQNKMEAIKAWRQIRQKSKAFATIFYASE